MKLNPMSEPPKDDRTVYIVVKGRLRARVLSPGYFEHGSWWAIRFSWGDEDAWPIEDHLPEPLGWIECPKIDIEETGT